MPRPPCLPRALSFALALPLATCLPPARAAARARPAAGAPARVSVDLPRFLASHCQGCHGPEQRKGGLRVDTLDPDLASGPDGERWQAVLDALHKGEMPPEDAAQPPDPERRAAIAGLEAALAQAARAQRAQAASVLRRLTREQYSRTLADLLGVDSDYARLLPPESPSKMGMHNDGRVLTTSTLHLEQTLHIARAALGRALSLGEPPHAWRYRFVFGPQERQPAAPVDLGYQAQPLAPHEFLVETFADRGPLGTPTLAPRGPIRERCYVDLRGSTDHDHKDSPRRYAVDARGLTLLPAKPHVEREAQIWQGPNPNVALVLRDFPVEGAFELRVIAARAASGGATPWLRAFAGNRLDDGMQVATIGEAQPVTAPPGQPQVIPFRGRLENLPLPIVDPHDQEFLANLMVIGVWNDVLVTRPEEVHPALIIQAIEFEGPLTEAWPSASHRQVFFDDRRKARPAEYAREILRRFLTRAFRRPPTAAQLERYLAHWRDQRRTSSSFEHAIAETLAAALASPAFLHHVEPTVPDGRGRARLDDFALASRLSYFLWGSMPDARLLEVAARGQLAGRLVEEAGRLLDDPRARAFSESFARQWLDLDALDRVQVDVGLHPGFTRFVREDMRQETTRFLDHLLRHDRPLHELVDADYTLASGPLAAFYGAPRATREPVFQVLPLPAGTRGGGLLTQGSFLVGHATGQDSHPIKRGVWLIRRLLDDPPPPPPPNVPELDREDPELARLPVRRQLELHRSRAACRDCHRKLDPWGIPLEEFDAAGLPRREIARKVGAQVFRTPVDARGELPDGTVVDGAAALRAHLRTARLPQLRRSVARHLAAYALGRTPGFVDEATVQDIAARAAARGDGLRALLLAVIDSDAFRSK